MLHITFSLEDRLRIGKICLLGLLFVRISSASGGLVFSTDTVYETAVGFYPPPGYSDTVLVTNTSSAPVTIDSVGGISVDPAFAEYELVVLYSIPPSAVPVREWHVSSYSPTDARPIAIEVNGEIVLRQFEFDKFGLTKGTKKTVEDTVVASVIFFHGLHQDTLHVVAKYKLPTGTIGYPPRSAERVGTNPGENASPLFDLRGRSVSSSTTNLPRFALPMGVYRSRKEIWLGLFKSHIQ